MGELLQAHCALARASWVARALAGKALRRARDAGAAAEARGARGEGEVAGGDVPLRGALARRSVARGVPAATRLALRGRQRRRAGGCVRGREARARGPARGDGRHGGRAVRGVRRRRERGAQRDCLLRAVRARRAPGLLRRRDGAGGRLAVLAVPRRGGERERQRPAPLAPAALAQRSRRRRALRPAARLRPLPGAPRRSGRWRRAPATHRRRRGRRGRPRTSRSGRL